MAFSMAHIFTALLPSYKIIKPKLPWFDRAGHFSRLKLSVFLACLAPALWIVFAFNTGLYDPKPITQAIHATGDWSVRILLASLTITPLRHITMRARVMLVRRMVGLAAAFYVFTHFLLYCVDEKWVLSVITSEIFLRFYLTIGFIAVVGLLVLTLTSTDGMIKRLGAARWQTIHKSVYWLTVLALIHFILQSKLGVTEALLTSDIFIMLMLLRALVNKRIALTTWHLALLTIAMVLFAALSEAAFYAITRHIDFMRVLNANVIITNFRPSFGVCYFGLSLIIVRLIFLPHDKRRHAFRLFGASKTIPEKASRSTNTSTNLA